MRLTCCAVGSTLIARCRISLARLPSPRVIVEAIHAPHTSADCGGVARRGGGGRVARDGTQGARL
eukprot:4302239-Prymnesium_polylepis.1